jgi:microcystin-dependent protein
VSDPYIGEIRMFGGNFAPAGWAFCDGQLMPISENDALFTLIGTTYGGDGQETFALPNLQSRVPIHAGQGPGLSNNYQLAEMGGVEAVTLTTQQIPIHTHSMIANSGLASEFAPGGRIFAQPLAVDAYVQPPPAVALSPQSCSATGGSQPHDNIQPYLCISFIMSMFGIFPTQT